MKIKDLIDDESIFNYSAEAVIHFECPSCKKQSEVRSTSHEVMKGVDYQIVKNKFLLRG